MKIYHMKLLACLYDSQPGTCALLAYEMSVANDTAQGWLAYLIQLGYVQRAVLETDKMGRNPFVYSLTERGEMIGKRLSEAFHLMRETA